MTAAKPRTLGDEWKTRLDLSNRRVPEFYETADVIRDTPHASAIRAAIEEDRRAGKRSASRL